MMFTSIASCLRGRKDSDADHAMLAIMPSIERIVMSDDLRSTLSRDASSLNGRVSQLSRCTEDDKENAHPVEMIPLKTLSSSQAKDELEDEDDATTSSFDNLSIKNDTTPGDSSDSSLTDEQQLLLSLDELRRLMTSAERGITLDRLVDAGLIRIVVACLSANCAQAQRNAAQVLSTIASDVKANHVKAVMDAGGLKAILDCLTTSEDVDFIEELLFGLTAILQLHPVCIEHCVSHGLVESVHSMCQRMRPPARILRTILTLVLHIGVPKGPLPISDTLPLFYNLLQNADITPEAAKTLYDMTLAERRLQKIIGVSVEDMRGINYLVALLQHSSQRARMAALYIVEGSIINNGATTPAFISAGILEALPAFLGHQRPDVVKPALRVLRTLTSCSHQEVVERGLLLAVSELFGVYDTEMQQIVVECVKSVLANGDAALQRRMVVPLCHMLGPFATEVVACALDELHQLLSNCSESQLDKVKSAAIGVLVLDKLERLQCHSDDGVSKSATAMIEAYFLEPGARRMFFRPHKPVMVKFSSTE